MRKLSLTTTLSHQGKRLDQVLAEWLPVVTGEAVSKAKVRKLIVAGAVYLNRRRVRIASKNVLARARIEVFYDAEKLKGGEATSRDRPFEMSKQDILFEDAFVIAVNKPPGLPTQPTLDEARANLYASVKKFLGPTAYVGLHHRLDRDTSGVVLFTKAKAANAGVADAFAKHRARKTYLALVGRPAKDVPALGSEWAVENFLARDKGTPRFRSVRAGGDPARTEFRVLESLSEALLVEARPLTGRTHQIRVHLAEAGMPILGDDLYGRTQSLENREDSGPVADSRKTHASPSRSSLPSAATASATTPATAPRLMLHAQRLVLPHPQTRAELSIESPLPADFAECLRARRGPV